MSLGGRLFVDMALDVEHERFDRTVDELAEHIKRTVNTAAKDAARPGDFHTEAVPTP
eukprot:SAG31_NODE_19924_length_588_cov_1.038855_1_plen_57_part_00